MHIGDGRPEFLSRFDPVAFVAMLKRAGAQSVVLYAHSHVGHCYFPTRVGHAHGGLKGRDVFGATLERCREAGIFVVAYMSVGYDTWAARTHPDWQIHTADGTPWLDQDPHPGGAHGRRYGVCCFNSPYRDYAVGLAAEICGGYAVDGIRFDMTFWPAVCYCRHCGARFADEVGGPMPTRLDWEDPHWVAFQRCRERWLTEFAARATAAARQAQPGVTVEHQASTLPASWVQGVTVDLVAQNDFLQGDFYGGNLQGSFVKKLLGGLTPHSPLGFETSSGVSLGDAVTLKSRELLRCKAFSAVAHNAAFVFIDAADPVGTLNPRVYERCGEVFREASAFDSERGGEPLQDVAIYFSTESKFNFADRGQPVAAASSAMPHLDAAMGAARVLMQEHIPFGVITRRDLRRLRAAQVLVLPDVLMMSGEEADAIRAFVRGGGGLYASRYSARHTSDGGPTADFLLADVFGVSAEALTSAAITYVAPTPAGRPLLAGCSDVYPLTVSAQMRVRAHDGAEVLGRLVLPWTDPADFRGFASIHSNPPGPVSDRPALVRHRFGRGLAIYSAGVIERESGEAQQQVFAALICSLARRPFRFEARAPKAVEVTVFHQPARRRFLVNLLNYQELLPNVPVSGATVRVWVGRQRRVRRALVLPAERPVPWRRDGEYVVLRVPRIETFRMVALEYR
jgi:hypothetical protein